MPITNQSRGPENSVDENLQAALLDTERHVADDGWGQAARPFALFRSSDLLFALPDDAPVAGELGEQIAEQPDHLSPVELESMAVPGVGALEHVEWPGESAGAALVLEHEAIGAAPGTAPSADATAEIARLAVGVLWDGPAWTVVRFADGTLNGGSALVPELTAQLRASGAELAT